MGQRQGITHPLLAQAQSSETGTCWTRSKYQRVIPLIFRHVKADAIVVRNWDELNAKKDQVKGKIVVYNQGWTNYYDTVEYRVLGAERAAALGAVGALVRSIASNSIYSPHAGGQYNQEIPIAAITVEDAEMLQRMQNRGQKITLELIL